MKCSNMAASAVLVLLLAGTHYQAAASRPSKAVAPQKSTTTSAVPAALEAKKGPQDRITFLRQLPVGPRLNSNHFSGYITLNHTKNHKMFYVFGEAETNPQDAPLIFWMNGGPGCSSVGLGFIKGNGPFIPVSNDTVLLENPNRFTTFANVLWMEQPAFVGYSMSNDEGDRESDDTKTAQGMLDFLLSWYERFPQYRDHELFLAGQSYAGHYGPMLAKTIMDYNDATRKANEKNSERRQGLIIPLKGLKMGNAWTDPVSDNTATLNFWYNNALISRDIYDELAKCDLSLGALWRTDGASGFTPECEALRNRAYKQIGEIDQFGLNAPHCVGKGRNATYPEKDYNFWGWQQVDPCAGQQLTKLMNRRDVQLAFGAIQESDATREWKGCIGRGLHYSNADLARSMVPIYKELVSRGLNVLWTSGETDAFVPLAGSRAWIESLNLPLLEPDVPIRQWVNQHTEQIGGTVTEYQGLTRVSVRFAGHSLMAWQPHANKQILSTWVSGGRLPTYDRGSHSLADEEQRW